MTKVSELEFTTKLLSEDDIEGFPGVTKVSTAIIDKGFPFTIAIMYLPKIQGDEAPYDVMFLDRHLDHPVPVKEIIAKDILDEINCKHVTDSSILRMDENTVNSIIEVAESFGAQVKQYLDVISEYSDRIIFFPKTMQ